MSEVVRTVKTIQHIAYTLDADAVRGALSAFLYDEHSGSFTPETTVEFRKDGGAIVTTPFEIKGQSA